MSEEESNEDSNKEEKEEGEENEDEEKEEDEDNEGEEKEDDEDKEEDEDNEGEEKEEEEDEEDDKKKKKKKDKKKDKKKGKKKDKKKDKEKDKGKDEDDKKEVKEINSQNKETKNVISPMSTNEHNLMFNGNDITVGNIVPKKSTIQILMEITTDMDNLSAHIEKTMPIKQLPIITNNIKDYSYNNNYNNYVNANISFANLDKEDLEIKQLINKANELSNMSRLNTKKNEIKTFENKCVQSDEEIDNQYNNQTEEKEQSENNINYNNINERRNEFPYDPYKHLGYYNNLQNNNRRIQNDNRTYRNQNRQINEYNQNDNFQNSYNNLRIKKMDELYNMPSINKKQPIIYTQPESKSNTMRNKVINKFNENYDINNVIESNNINGRDNFSDKNDEKENFENNNNQNNINNNESQEINYQNNNNNYINNNSVDKNNNFENNNNININKKNYINTSENKFERFRPRSINHAMNILLDKE